MKPGIDYIGVSVPFYCHDKDGNFLLHKRSEKCRDERGRWDFGGGKVEFGETLEKAVSREVMEEYGVHAEIEKKLPAHSLLRMENGVKTHWLIISFLVSVDRARVKNNDPEKISEIGWFKLKALPSPLHTGAAYSLKNYRELFKKYI